MKVPTPDPIRIGFVLHVMQVAGAEVLVAETIRRLAGQIDPLVLCLDAVGQLGHQLQQHGVPVVALNRHPGLDRGLAVRLATQIRRHKLEIVHAHQYTPFFYSALARLFVRHRMHLLFTEHGRHYPDAVSWKRRLGNRFVLSRLADEVTGVCRFSADSLRRVDGFGERTPIGIVRNGVDVPRYLHNRDASIKSALGLRTDRRYLICIARFHPVKDHATLLRAFAHVVPHVADVDLLLVGDGPLRESLEHQVTALQIADRVRFLGIRHDIPELLRASDAFVMTSISEAASLTLLEAMASSLPVVVTAVGGNPEIVEHETHGFLVPRGDDVAAANAVMTLLQRPDCARAMGAAGREHVRAHFDLEMTVDNYLQRYRAAAARLREGSRRATSEPRG